MAQEFSTKKINFVINDISQEKFNELCANNKLSVDELYMTPDDGINEQLEEWTFVLDDGITEVKKIVYCYNKPQ